MNNVMLGIIEGILIVWSSLVLLDCVAFIVRKSPKSSFWNRHFWMLAIVIMGAIIGYRFLI